jgi:hypothetical protein
VEEATDSVVGVEDKVEEEEEACVAAKAASQLEGEDWVWKNDMDLREWAKAEEAESKACKEKEWLCMMLGGRYRCEAPGCPAIRWYKCFKVTKDISLARYIYDIVKISSSMPRSMASPFIIPCM